MIYVNNHLKVVWVPFKLVSPLLEKCLYCKQFLIKDLVVPFSLDHSPGQVIHQV